MRWITFFGLFWASYGIALTAEIPKELEELKSKYAEARKRIELPLTNLERDYALELKRLKSEAQEAGDLDQILVIDRVAAATANEEAEIPAQYQDLVAARGRFLRAIAQAKTPVDAQLEKLDAVYSRQLNSLLQGLTKQGRIADALVVKEVLDATEAKVIEDRPPTGDLIGHWTFDLDGTDSSPYRRHAVLHGNAAIVEGKIGDGALLTGPNQFAEIHHHADFDFPGPFTVAFWTNLTPGARQEVWGPLLTKTDNAWRIQLGPDAKKLVLHMSTNVGLRAAYSESDVLKEGRWHHVAGVFDGQVATLYIDGRKIRSTTDDKQFFPRKTDAPVRVGGNAANEHRTFNGKIDDVRIYKIALTRSNIVRLASGFGLPGIDPD